MTREELETEIDTVVIETATISKKDRDRLVDSLATLMIEEFGVEVDEKEVDEEEEG